MNETVEESLHSLDRVSSMALELALQYAPRAFTALVILVVGYYAGRWASRALMRALSRVQLDAPVRSLLGRFAHLAVLLLFALMALQNLGVELLPLVAGLGIAGAGIALALQGVLGNLVAGMTILLTRPFRVGDYISIVNEEGVVQDITLFNTTLQHADLSRVVIPNRKIVGEILHNFGQLRQLGIEVGVAYDTDLAAAGEAIRAVLGANPRVLSEPAPRVGVARLADSAIVMIVAPWVRVPDFGPANIEVSQAIVEAFRSRGITIPFPQREVRVLSTTAYVAAARDAA
jgi:small conductance mechanosensitive channel